VHECDEAKAKGVQQGCGGGEGRGMYPKMVRILLEHTYTVRKTRRECAQLARKIERELQRERTRNVYNMCNRDVLDVEEARGTRQVPKDDNDTTRKSREYNGD
jgi:hypothetical protein